MSVETEQTASGQKLVKLTPKGDRWVRTGHPWIFQNDLAEQELSWTGEMVQVQASNAEPLGQAFYNANSKITLRWVTRDPAAVVDRVFWAHRLDQAIAYRNSVVADSNAYRLIHAEADGFPGLIVDRYADHLVVQSLSLGIDQQMEEILPLLIERLSPQSVIARNDSPVRKREGLEPGKTVLFGEQPEIIEILEGNIKFRVDPWNGQKTGAYLDQRENRLWAAGQARGRVLDACAYQGGFALRMAAKADSVLALEDSQAAIEVLEQNIKLNGLSNVEVRKDNIFNALKEMQLSGERFDQIVLDPPAFAKSKREVPGALRGYREINRRALQMLQPGGMLITCSCSFAISESDFVQILREAAQGVGRVVRLIEKRTQGKDHPILLTHPESHYLKCFVLQVVD